MGRLLNTYRNNRSLSNAWRVMQYDKKHPFASVTLEHHSLVLLAEAIAHVGRYAEKGM